MAKKKKKKKPKCDTPNCLLHKWWPAVEPALGKHSSFWVDDLSGEVFIATGMRALPDMEVVEMEEGISTWFSVRCECGTEGVQREDLMNRTIISECPCCAANRSFTQRN